ncbi:hypothetical protein ES702_02602 [subsurface metagenome]
MMMIYSKIERIKHERKYLMLNIYFLVHSLLTATFFSLFVLKFELFNLDVSELPLAELLTWDLIMLWVSVISLSLLSTLLGRFLSYFFIFGIARKREREFIELNRKGINTISIHYIVSTIICSLLYCIVLILMIQNATVERESLTTYFSTYLLTHFLILGFSRIMSKVPKYQSKYVLDKKND